MDDGRRWNFDGKYTGKGRLWALLSGERGQYELALANTKGYPTDAVPQSFLAKNRLDSMAKFSNEGLMIPEQIWDSPNLPKNIDKQFIPELKFGEGTGSATPLAWSMAQFVRLAVNLQAGKNLDTPDVVYNRYVLGKKSEVGSQSMVGKIDECEKAKSFLFDDSKILQTIPQRTEKYPSVFGSKGKQETALRFAYFGIEKDVEIVGDFTGWKPCGLKFNKINGLPNVNSLSLKFPNSARVEYKLIVDGKWILDPLNPNKVDNGVGGENSFLTMPDYQATIWDKETPMTGKLETIEISSKVWNETRKIQVYTPQIQGKVQLSLKTSNPSYPVLYLQDGTDYINRAKGIQIQENLVKAGKIPAFMMVFVDYKDRLKEYWATDDYAKYLAEEVVPLIDKQYRTIQTPDGRAILGASLGGVTSVHTALIYPNIFGRTGGQSSSFWIDNRRVIKELENLDANQTKLKFYFDAGTIEGAGDDEKAVDILRKKGFNVTYEEAAAGHNWTSWRDRLADAFIALWN